ncbi:MAG: AmmeMemoRadiSam system protein B [Acidobacteria bacterium]|nr:AmmeMemoRadiSam system protein B [Acidobacteriota bacterium]
MRQELIREPAVSGMFYAGTESALRRSVREYLGGEAPEHDLVGCVAPHAGYMYSGPVAGKLYAHLRIPRRVIVLGPSHTGLGRPIAVAPHTAWSTPLGDVPIDQELASRLTEELPAVEADADAHWREHSIEVQIPFLQLRRPDVQVLPVCLKHLGLDDCLQLGRALARVIGDTGEPVGLVASSDMSHYEPDDEARRHDREAIDAALELDPAALYNTVHRRGITMCGVIPATVMLEAIRHLGANAGHLVAYATSGDTGGDRRAVVGYAGLCFYRKVHPA